MVMPMTIAETSEGDRPSRREDELYLTIHISFSGVVVLEYRK